MTTFLSIHRTEQGAITLDLDTSLFGSPTEPLAPAIPAQVVPAKPRSTRRTTAKAVAAKPVPATKVAKRTKKAVRPSQAPIYQAIRELCSQGKHDEAIAMVPANWPHVIPSIEAHRAKHGTVEAPAKVVKTKAPARTKATKVAPKATKAPAKVTKVTSKPAKAAAPASKREAKRAISQSKAPKGNKPQAFPTTKVVSEADLVLHWAAAAAAGHLDVVSTAHQITADSFRSAVASGNRSEAALMMKRLRNLDNLLRQAV